MAEEEKKNKSSEARLAANRKYISSLDKIQIRVKKPEEGEKSFKEQINEHAKRAGISANQYMIEAIQARMDQEDAASK